MKLPLDIEFYVGNIYIVDADNDRVCNMSASGFSHATDMAHARQIIDALNRQDARREAPSLEAACRAVVEHHDGPQAFDPVEAWSRARAAVDMCREALQGGAKP